MNKLITILYMFVIAVVMVSCNDTEEIAVIDDINENKPSAMMKVTDEGYLHLESQQAFDKLYAEVKGSTSSSFNSRANSGFNLSIPGFTSIKDVSDKYSNMPMSRAVSNTIETDYECEEGTEEECRLAIAEELIPDEALQCLLDTTFRIEIGNTYYRITYKGTLFADIEYKEKVDSVAESSDIVANAPVANGVYEVAPDVCIVDTYGNLCESEEIEAHDKTEDINAYNPWGNPSVPPITTTPTNNSTRPDSYYWGNEQENKSQYSLIDKKWDAKFFLGDIIEGIVGKNIAAVNKFDKNHRVECKLYDLNYGFTASVGYKISLQKRKKFLLIPFWISCGGAEDLVIGFEDFQCNFKLQEDFSINPVAVYEYRLSEAADLMLYNGLIKPLLIEDWAKEYLPCIFHNITTGPLSLWQYQPNQTTDDNTRKFIMEAAESLYGKKLHDMKYAFRKGDPVIHVNPYNSKEHDVFVYGINGWKNTNKKSIEFKAKALLFDSNGVIRGYNQGKCEIKRPQMFGAIKYDGKWRGVRFIE